jgi:hypothetical protein
LAALELVNPETAALNPNVKKHFSISIKIFAKLLTLLKNAGFKCEALPSSDAQTHASTKLRPQERIGLTNWPNKRANAFLLVLQTL